MGFSPECGDGSGMRGNVRVENDTPVVFNSYEDGRAQIWGGDSCWVRGVDVYGFMSGGVIGGAGGDAEEIFICHCQRNEEIVVMMVLGSIDQKRK